MKLTNKQWEEVHIGLRRLDENTVLPAKLAYTLARGLSALTTHMAAIQKARTAILHKYAPNQQSLPDSHPKYQEALAELAPILAELVELDVPTIAEEEILKISQSVSISALAGIMPLIKTKKDLGGT